jgi:transmembrane sensor
MNELSSDNHRQLFPGPDDLRQQAHDWVIQMTTSEMSDADVEALEHWRTRSAQHEAAFTRAQQVWKALRAPLQNDVSERRMVIHRPAAAPRVSRRVLISGVAAASVAVAGGAILARPPYDLWPSLAELGAEYRTGAGQQRNIRFKNDASIELNTRTALNVREEADARNIELISGEAAIVAGRELIAVLASGGRAQAANSQFLVRCDSSMVQVTCLSGLVSVVYANRTVILNARQQISYHANVIRSAASINPDVVTAWKNGILIFDNELLADVIEELNRYRAGRIILMNKSLGEQRVTGRFKIARLDRVLKQFQAVFGARVTTLPGGIEVLS